MVDGHTVVKTLAWMMGLSVASSVALFFRFRSPATDWIDHANAYKRWTYRGLLLMACFLLPVSICALALDMLSKLDLFDSLLTSLSPIGRLLTFVVPVLVLWYLVFRAIVAETRSNAGRVRDSNDKG